MIRDVGDTGTDPQAATIFPPHTVLEFVGTTQIDHAHRGKIRQRIRGNARAIRAETAQVAQRRRRCPRPLAPIKRRNNVPARAGIGVADIVGRRLADGELARLPNRLRGIGAEPPTTEPFPREPILGAEVDTLVQDHAVVDVLDVERVDLAFETGRKVSCRRGVAHNVVRKQRLIVQQRGGGRRLDRVLLLGAIIVHLQREAFRKRRLKHRAVEFIS